MSVQEQPLDWTTANQRHLSAELEVVRAALIDHAARIRGEAPPGTEHTRTRLKETEAALSAPSALDTLTQAFGLSSFERSILVLCAGVELDAAFAGDVAAAQGNPLSIHPTFSLAMAALPDAHWSATSPSEPLRRWRLVEILHGNSLTSSPLRIDERVLHYLAGVPHLDDRLQGLVAPAEPWDQLPASLHATAHRVTDLLARAGDQARRPLIQLHGPDRSSLIAVAAQACAEVDLTLFILRAADLPSAVTEREMLARLLEREVVLGRVAFLVAFDEADGPEAAHSALALVETASTPVLIAAREPVRSGAGSATGSAIGIHVERPSAEEQRELWRTALRPISPALNGSIEPVVSHFNLALPAIQAVSGQVLARVHPTDESSPPTPSSEDLGRILWEACREQARPRLESLAQRIAPIASWDDIVLPEPQLQTLREITAHVRHRSRVYESWGFARKSARGLGITALFAGPSGTGKTMAAEVLARDLRLDLYSIDLSQVVSKYIGETEKNLRRVFDAAEEGGTVLLFDEADALFGKRSEVKDSHDRYANIEVSYLLQRMESYRGLAILTTNMKSALDTAFLRRLRFMVQFQFPEPAQRAEIWRRVFPAETPTEGLDVDKLARLGVAGGNIRSIAMNAAFLAADDDEPIRMLHLLRAVRTEYAKIEKPLTDAELGGWM